MSCVEYESYYIKQEELKILLAGAGITSWYGLWGREEACTAARQNRIVTELYRKGFVEFKENSVLVKKPVSTMLSVLTAGKECIVVTPGNPQYPVRCCYFSGDSVVLMEKSQRERDTVCLFLLTRAEWMQLLESEIGLMEELLPQEDVSCDTAWLTWDRTDTECLKEPSVQWVFTFRSSRKEAVYARLLIQKQGLSSYIVRQDAKESWAVYYSGKLLRAYLEEWLEGMVL